MKKKSQNKKKELIPKQNMIAKLIITSGYWYITCMNWDTVTLFHSILQHAGRFINCTFQKQGNL